MRPRFCITSLFAVPFLVLFVFSASAQTIIRITAVPAPSGIVSTQYLDGNDGGAAPPSAPQISQPAVNDSSSASVPLLTVCTGGTPPLVYEIEKSSTSAVAGFAIHASGITFTDGIYTIAGLNPSTQYWIQLVCVDSASRRSAYSSVFTFTTLAAGGGGDIQAPTAPTITSLTSPSAGTALLAWTNGTDNVGITQTRITRALGTGAGGTCDAQTTGVVIATVSGSTLSYQDAGLIVGQEYVYRVKHSDAAGNLGPNSTPRECVVISSNGAGVNVKWHPGHYVKTQGEASDGTPYWDGVFNNHLPKALESSNLKGALVEITWGDFNTTGSTYDWTRVDQVLAWADANNKRVIFKISYKTFASTIGNLGPADLEATDAVPTQTGFHMAIWRPSVMDRFIAAQQAFAARYDSHPRVEFITGSESATSFGTAGTPSDYTKAGHSAQLQRLYLALKAAWLTTSTAASLNSLTGQMVILLESAYSAKIGLNTPDAFDSCVAILFRGTTAVCSNTTGVPPRNYRDLMAYHTIASHSVLGGTHNNGPPANLIDWAQLNEVTHISWVTTVSVSPNTWAEIKAAIAVDPLTNQTCPAVYTSCNTN